MTPIPTPFLGCPAKANLSNRNRTATDMHAFTLAASRESCPRKKWTLVQGHEKPETPSGKNFGFSNDRIPLQAKALGTKVTSAKRRLCEKKLARLAKRFTLEELLNFATRKGANLQTATPTRK